MTKNNTARFAGLMYLLLVVTGIYNLLYVPSQLVVMSDVIKTIDNIKSNEFLFRSGIVTGVISYVFYAVLALALFDLFKDISKRYAVLMVALAVVSVPISIFNMVEKVNVLNLVTDASYLAVMSIEQVQSQVLLSLKAHNHGIMVVQIFWGLWLFPFGYLAFKSGHIPKILAVSLMLGCFGYLIKFSSRLLFPEIQIPSFIGYPASFGEIGTCLWLLIMGARQKSLNKHAAV